MYRTRFRVHRDRRRFGGIAVVNAASNAPADNRAQVATSSGFAEVAVDDCAWGRRSCHRRRLQVLVQPSTPFLAQWGSQSPTSVIKVKRLGKPLKTHLPSTNDLSRQFFEFHMH